jgi:D-amino-acid dehydrogenase
MSRLRIAVVGAGIIGLAVTYHLVRSGVRVIMIDRDPEEEKVSYGNAGGIAVTEVFPASAPGVFWRVLGWMLDPLGPVAVRPAHVVRLLPWLVHFARSGRAREVQRISRALTALNSRASNDLALMLGQIGLSSELRRTGALTLYETEAGYRRDAPEWACKRANGIVAKDLTMAEARELEPALGPIVQRAVLTPDWSLVSNPRRIAFGLREWLLREGVEQRIGDVRDITQNSSGDLVLELPGSEHTCVDKVVVAAGAWSGAIARRLGDRVLLESERGYTATLPSPRIGLTRELIFAERKFVAAPLDCGLRIGGAAEFAGLKARFNFQRARVLLKLAQRYLPELDGVGATFWAGHRPTTPDSLPVIGPSAHFQNVFYAFGHGHLGLTQAATTGQLLSDLIMRRPPAIDPAPYRIQRFNASPQNSDAAAYFPVH